MRKVMAFGSYDSLRAQTEDHNWTAMLRPHIAYKLVTLCGFN